MTKPGQLTLCIMAHVQLGLLDCAFQITPAIQILDYAAISVRAQGIRARRHALRQQPGNFINQTVGEMLLSTFVDPRIEFSPWGTQRKDANARGERGRVGPQRPLPGDGLARLKTKFDGALHSRPITWGELACFIWIELSQHAVEMFGAAGFAYSRQALTQLLVSRRTGKEWLAQSSQVKAGTTDQEHDVAARFDLFNLFASRSGPVSSSEINLWRNEVQQVMWNSAPFGDGHFCSRDLNVLIDLNRIAVDDLATQAQGEFNAQLAFS